MATEQGAKVAGVYRINYDLDNSKWVAHVAAFSDKEAVMEIRKNVPSRVKNIEAISHHSELDMVSEAIRKDINFPKNQKIKKLKARIKELEKAKDLRTIPSKKAEKK